MIELLLYTCHARENISGQKLVNLVKCEPFANYFCLRNTGEYFIKVYNFEIRDH